MPKLLSEVGYGAFLAYSPNGGENEPHRSSKLLRSAVKSDGNYRREPAIPQAVRRLTEVWPQDLRDLFGSGVVLVPAPRSAPFPERLEIPLQGTEKDFLWVPRRICEELVAAKLAASWAPLLRRKTKVKRSAAAEAPDRPLPAEHLASMVVDPQRIAATSILVVDDVVTRGSTLLACCSLLQDAFPQARVTSFALLRAVSNPEEFHEILAPVVGTIKLRPAGDTLRRP